MAKLYFRYGAMGCGKTAQLLVVAFNYEERGQKVCVIKPAIDTKNDKKLLSRIGLSRDTDFVFSRDDNLFSKIKEHYAKVNCVLVDEAQFLTPKQADELSEVASLLNIPVICYGLRLNFKQNDSGFEGATRLLQLAHEIEELKTICDCGKKATRNLRFLNGVLMTEGEAVVIDDGKTEVKYKAFCPDCYYKMIGRSK
ncbi:thymidine kinase [Candidatus Saccharibacteria bacterium]|nr:thymidine kinase [Candidatus Saccharibacteria bacterium]